MSNISVIVPCYNGADLLPRCLDSLVCQTLKLHQIIVVNDGSTDDSLQIALQYAEQYDNIKVVNKENQGLPQARKTGIAHATGLYIGFVDCDDWCAPEMYETLYVALCRQRADIACCGIQKVYEDGRSSILKQWGTGSMFLSKDQAFHLLHTRQNVFTYMPNKLFRLNILNEIEFPTGSFVGEDYVTFVQILLKAQSVVIVNKPLYMYWQSPNSMSRGGFKQSHHLAYTHYRQMEAMLLSQCPEMAEDVCAYLSVEYMSFVIAMSRNGNYDYEMLHQIQTYVRNNLPSLIKNKDYRLLYKTCAIAFSVNYKIMTIAYRIFTKKSTVHQ